ncbi:hypothetical protein JZ751_015508 [Albula glossodonta]|uniref:RanBD1 domain-containing protein n=1 Tax=Albula glossodonta TaxID=121402 RepID=A0A8T2N6U5_9TELE|nr:hypothetical protein JZ751_015508 [Albula glossodonta]
MADLVNEEKPAIAPPVFVFQKEKATKRAPDGSSGEDGEVSKNNVFLPSSFCQSPTGNSDSEPEEKTVGFRLKPPTLIHGQAPSAGVPSQKPKEQQRTVLRPALLQAPPTKALTQSNPSGGTNGLKPSEEQAVAHSKNDNTHTAPGEASTAQEGKAPRSTPADPSFVFGQNIKERAKVDDSSEPSLCKDATDIQSGGTNYFLQYIRTSSTQNPSDDADTGAKFIQCKLFVFDKTSQSWVERGRGLLRLNDMASTDDGTLQSRLVMRTQGSLRLILNTKLWSQMQIDKASEKSIRITAMDTEDQGVKVFLISASSKDTGQLSAALHHRILALRSRAEQEVETKPILLEPGVPQSHEDDSDEDVLSPSANTTSNPAPTSGNYLPHPTAAPHRNYTH